MFSRWGNVQQPRCRKEYFPHWGKSIIIGSPRCGGSGCRAVTQAQAAFAPAWPAGLALRRLPERPPRSLRLPAREAIPCQLNSMSPSTATSDHRAAGPGLVIEIRQLITPPLRLNQKNAAQVERNISPIGENSGFPSGFCTASRTPLFRRAEARASSARGLFRKNARSHLSLGQEPSDPRIQCRIPAKHGRPNKRKESSTPCRKLSSALPRGVAFPSLPDPCNAWLLFRPLPQWRLTPILIAAALQPSLDQRQKNSPLSVPWCPHF
jgi:hypothetical protein